MKQNLNFLHKNDSAESYLKEAYEGSDNPDFKCKVLFAMANLYRSEDKNDKADKTFKQIIDEYPMASLANESRKLMGIPQIELETHDAVDSIINNGEEKFISNDYYSALASFENIVSKDTTSKYYLRSAYASGWIYENILNKPDSALLYYTKILNFDPSSDINKLVSSKVTEYNQEKTRINDSLSHKNDSLSVDSLKIKQDSLNIHSPDKKNEDIKKGEGDNFKNGDGTDKKKDEQGNPDMKKDDGSNPDPIKSK